MSNERLVGVDSLGAVTSGLAAEATQTLGQVPTFWGRYFTRTTARGVGEYHHASEGPALGALGIRVLPIARQTNDVSGTFERGIADGLDNARDLAATFGPTLASMSNGVRLFLDVEGSGGSHLSVEYYQGWVRGLQSGANGFTVLPCVYGTPGDQSTWQAVATAVAAGTSFFGAWFSHPYRQCLEPVQWRADMLGPLAEQPGLPVLLWQYCFGEHYDRSLINPALGAAQTLLETLIAPLPPQQTQA